LHHYVLPSQLNLRGSHDPLALQPSQLVSDSALVRPGSHLVVEVEDLGGRRLKTNPGSASCHRQGHLSQHEGLTHLVLPSQNGDGACWYDVGHEGLGFRKVAVEEIAKPSPSIALVPPTSQQLCSGIQLTPSL